jgi:hypothetical protein
MNKKEKIAIGWCDNGITDGSFTESLVNIVLNSSKGGWEISETVRVQGNQIAVQRQTLIDYWFNNFKSDWLLCVDSDICLNMDAVKKIFDTANKNTHKIVSGIYFIAKEYNGSLPIIMPCIFDDVNDNLIKYHHPLPKESIIKVDCAGLGFVIIHRSVIKKLKDDYGSNSFLFSEIYEHGSVLGEDISFFRKCKKTNIPVYAHTGAIVKHIKRVAWDMDYYALYWNQVTLQEQNKNTPSN